MIDLLERRVRAVRPRDTRCYVPMDDIESSCSCCWPPRCWSGRRVRQGAVADRARARRPRRSPCSRACPTIELPPTSIFLVFLPPLVYAAGWRPSPQELRAVMRPLGVLAVGLVFVTAAVVAVVAHALVPGLSWAEAAVLGAVLAPTDAVAADRRPSAASARPERVRLVVEGESMINDGTALVLYRIAVGVATGGAFSLGDAALEFVGVSAGGIAVGPRRRLPRDPRHPPPDRHRPRHRAHRAHRLRRLHRRRGAARLGHPRRGRRRPLRRLPRRRSSMDADTRLSARRVLAGPRLRARDRPCSSCSGCSCRRSSTRSSRRSSGIGELLGAGRSRSPRPRSRSASPSSSRCGSDAGDTLARALRRRLERHARRGLARRGAGGPARGRRPPRRSSSSPSR